MKSKNLIPFALITVLFTACTNAPDSDKATTSDEKTVEAVNGDSWKIDPSASTIKWVGTKVSGYHTGNISIAEGTLQVNDGEINGGKVLFDMSSIKVTGPEGSDPASDAKLQGHLLSADFFDVEKHPEGTLEITSVKPYSSPVAADNDPRQEELNPYKVANPTHMVGANLTLKGITKNIEFPASINMTENSMEANAKFNIDRTQWEIVYPGQPDDLIRNDIHVGLSVKASK